MKKSNEQGFGLIVVVLAVVTVGVIAFGAVRVMGIKKTPLVSNAAVISRSKVPAAVKSTADLRQASKALDETPVDSGVNPDQLNNDLNSLL